MASYFGPSLGFRGRGGAVPALPAAAPGSGGSSAAPHSLAPPTQSKISIFFPTCVFLTCILNQAAWVQCTVVRVPAVVLL